MEYLFWIVVILLLVLIFFQQQDMKMTLSTRAQAIVDRLNRLNTVVQTQIAAEEAAHDAANEAAASADDDGIEGALSTIETGLGIAPGGASPAAPAPDGTPVSNPSGDPLPTSDEPVVEDPDAG